MVSVLLKKDRTTLDTTELTRILIDTTVTRGIKDIQNDPKRSLRKLADLGKHFSTGGFQKTIIDIIRGLLENDESPYYDMLSDFLNHTDTSSIKNFGINMGYNSWTLGARTIRSLSEKKKLCMPWVLIINYSHDKCTDGNHLLVSDISRIISAAKPLGINSFCIIQRDGDLVSDELLSLFAQNKECAFFYMVSRPQITTSQASDLKAAGNTLLCIDFAEPSSLRTCKSLRESKVLYSLFFEYTDADLEVGVDEASLTKFLEYNSGMIFFVQKDMSGKSAGQEIKEIRMEQLYPSFVWDLYADIREISKIIVGEPNTIIEINSDGSFKLPKQSGLNILDEGETLEHAICSVMPPFPVGKK